MKKFLSFLFGLHFLYVLRVNGECNGVGNIIEDLDVCNCTNAFPRVGESGWTGQACEIRVYGANLDSTDMTLGCREENCHVLVGSNVTCFAVPILWRDFNEPWNFLAVQLTRSSESGDPDLYGIFTGGPNSQHRIPTIRESGYDFIEISSRAHVSVVKKIEKRDFGFESDYTGLYLCTRPYGGGTTEFELRGQATLCPSGYLDNGAPTMCSTSNTDEGEQRRYSECRPDGVCVCEGIFARPEGSAVEGVGFEDCSAKITSIEESDFTNNSFTAWHNYVPGGQWDYYAFNVSSSDFHVVARAILEVGNEGIVEVYARMGEPPKKSHPDFNLRSAYRYLGGEDPSVQMKRGDDEFREGLWYVGVYSDDNVMSSYSMKISKFICMNDCNQNGECQLHSDGINKCNCHRGYFLEDCAATGRILDFNEVYVQEETNIEYEYFQFPKISALSSGNNVEITMEAQYESTYFPSFASSTPKLVLLEGGSRDYPTLENYTYKVDLKEQRTTYSIGLCPSVLAGGNLWRAAIYNPIPGYQMGYTVKLKRRVHCLNDCSGNGSCNDNGTCLCKNNFSGGDCSVDVSASGCIDGSRIPGKTLIDHGTCWQTCRCKSGEGCRFEENCSEVTCDEGWRLSRNTQECVKDQCTDSMFHVTEDYFCVRPCQRPSNAPSRLSPDCDPRTFHCRKGTRVFDEEGAPYCTGACVENSLQSVSVGVMDNAHSFTPCVCAMRGSEGKVCQTLQNVVVLHCEDGYVLRGGDDIPGSKFKSGGKCVKISEHGMAGWTILLIGVSTLIVGFVIGAVVARRTSGVPILETMQRMYYEKMRGRSSSFEPNEF